MLLDVKYEVGGQILCTYDVICEPLHNFVFLFYKRFLPKDFRHSSLLTLISAKEFLLASVLGEGE